MNKKDRKIIKKSKKHNFPIFVLSGKDKMVLSILREYRSLAIVNNLNRDFIEELEKRIIEFELWQEENPDKVKFPD